MKKLQLKLDALEVLSFHTAAAESGSRGTVRGNMMVSGITCEGTCQCPSDQSYWCPWTEPESDVITM
ncbi:MAG TPA: hypothetical protein VFJ82_09580 [Longimicrobium sp.]|nr:hypothetical protein [Longimicrobium sp.]